MENFFIIAIIFFIVTNILKKKKQAANQQNNVAPPKIPNQANIRNTQNSSHHVNLRNQQNLMKQEQLKKRAQNLQQNNHNSDSQTLPQIGKTMSPRLNQGNQKARENAPIIRSTLEGIQVEHQKRPHMTSNLSDNVKVYTESSTNNKFAGEGCEEHYTQGIVMTENKLTAKKNIFNLSPNTIVQGIIMSEILTPRNRRD